MNVPMFVAVRFTAQGVGFATPVLEVTVHWLLVAGLLALLVAYRRQVVRVRREMRARRAVRLSAGA